MRRHTLTVDKLFLAHGRPVTIGGKTFEVEVRKTLTVVFHETKELWSCPEYWGDEQMKWSQLRRKILRSLLTKKRIEVTRDNTPEKRIDIAPKSASEMFG